jgi:regulator of sirC expression with transglutaminase-like and TPR domain
MDKNKISALISLLDDPDENIFQTVRDELIAIGSEVIPDLEESWQHSSDPACQERIESLIHHIQLSGVREQLVNWAKEEQPSVFDGALLVARFQFPDLNEERLRAQLDQIKQDIWIEMNENLTALEIARVMNHIIFDVHGFGGNSSDFHSPSNSFINQVIETRKGNPLSLSIIYQELARKLDIPVYGVNLPQHFILAFLEKEHHLPLPDAKKEQPVLFYVNAFSRGSMFQRSDVDQYLQNLKLQPELWYYNPCSPVEMIRRMLNNLIYSFEKAGNKSKVNELRDLFQALRDL